jgi:hypothetical protein
MAERDTVERESAEKATAERETEREKEKAFYFVKVAV